MKVISGGQIGADIAGLRAAQEVGFETGGWMPKEFRTLAGAHPEYAEKYGMLETADGGYPVRTRLNVKTADVTLRFGTNFMTYGERATERFIRELKKPHLDIHINIYETNGSYPTVLYTTRWLQVYKPEIINIAGNANKVIEPFVQYYLKRVFDDLKIELR